ncbi:MAG: hypothetical protein IPN72_16365 [Saprospiraceae bacterium]|nr:hypothetical protein [Saprospiraceae bacterium]
MKSIYIFFLIFLLHGTTYANDYRPCYGVLNATIKVGETFSISCIPETTITLNDKQKVVVSRMAICNNRVTDYYEIFIDANNYFVHKSNLNLSYEDKNAFISNQKLDLDTLLQGSKELSIWVGYQNAIKELELKRKKEGIISFIKKCATDGIAIVSWGVQDESEYTDGTSLIIGFLNPTKKAIKYVWVDIVGYDPVGEKVIERGTSKKSVKCVGPIEPMETGTYEFEYVWFTDLVETAKLGTIKVQYMDNTFKTVLKPDKVTFPSELVTPSSESYD